MSFLYCDTMTCSCLIWFYFPVQTCTFTTLLSWWNLRLVKYVCKKHLSSKTVLWLYYEFFPRVLVYCIYNLWMYHPLFHVNIFGTNLSYIFVVCDSFYFIFCCWEYFYGSLTFIFSLFACNFLIVIVVENKTSW